jgi:hypothetical protein
MVAAVATIIAVLAVVFPGVGIGVPTTTHGGPPSDVFANTEPEICAEGVDVNGFAFLPTAVSFGEDSNLLASFTFEYSGPDPRTELLIAFEITDEGGNFPAIVATPFEWGMPGAPTAVQHSTATTAWSFASLPAGDYLVWASARVDPYPPGPGGKGNPSATLENCALTVSVIPPKA